MATFRPRAVWLVASLAGVSLGACNQILDIQDAQVDARLTAAGRAGSSNGPGAGSGGSEGPGSGGSDSSGSAGRAEGQGAAGMASAEAGEGGSDFGLPDMAGKGGQGGSGGKPGNGGSGKGGSSHGNGAEGGEGTVEPNGEGGDNSMGPKDPCEEYCDEMDTACTGEAMQYRDRAQCLKICKMLPEGAEENEDEDSVACRLKYVKKTKYALGAEVTAYCQQAGPSGNGKCGSICQAFCTVMLQVCTEDSAGPYHFESTEDCLAECDALPASPVAYSPNDPRVSDGNHAACRLFHVNSAAMADAEEHCEHAMGITLCEATP